MVAWIPLNLHIPQDRWNFYHDHQTHFQTGFKYKIFHNLDPDTLLELSSSMVVVTTI